MTDNIFLKFVKEIPPITRSILVLVLISTLMVYIGVVSPYQFMYTPAYLRKLHLWRPITCFLFFGRPSLEVLMHIVFLYRYSKMLEEEFIQTSDFAYLVLVVSSTIFLIANMYKIVMLGAAFSSTITYIWTRKNPRAIVQIFGFITFPAFYLPFIVPVFTLLTERRVMVEDVLGILVGHLYFFFKEVYPKIGRDWLRTPCWMKKLFGEHQNGCCHFKRVSIRKSVSSRSNADSPCAIDDINTFNSSGIDEQPARKSICEEHNKNVYNDVEQKSFTCTEDSLLQRSLTDTENRESGISESETSHEEIANTTAHTSALDTSIRDTIDEASSSDWAANYTGRSDSEEEFSIRDSDEK